MTTDRKYDEIDFLTHLIKQCPDKCVVEFQCNWTNTSYTDKEFVEISGCSSLEDCKSDRETEVFKSTRFDNYKYKSTKFGQSEIWDGGLNLFITTKSKEKINENIRTYLDGSDVCHCQVYTESTHIAECYDSFNHNKLDNSFFKFTVEEIQNYARNNIDISFN